MRSCSPVQKKKKKKHLVFKHCLLEQSRFAALCRFLPYSKVTQAFISIHSPSFTVFHPGLSQETGYRSLCCTAALPASAFLHVVVCASANSKPPSSPLPSRSYEIRDNCFAVLKDTPPPQPPPGSLLSMWDLVNEVLSSSALAGSDLIHFQVEL